MLKHNEYHESNTRIDDIEGKIRVGGGEYWGGGNGRVATTRYNTAYDTVHCRFQYTNVRKKLGIGKWWLGLVGSLVGVARKECVSTVGTP